MKTFFSLKKVNQLRDSAREARSIGKHRISGWSKSPIDPKDLLDVFDTIQIKSGFTLHGYIYRENENGNGVIWAVPDNSPYLEPENCIQLEDKFLSPPKPPCAVDDFMKVVEGDGSPWSYLSASIFMREAHEFGALWHGCAWSDVTILDKDITDEEEPSKNENWEWEAEKPEKWEPLVEMENKFVKVSIILFNPVGINTISLMEDTYSIMSYEPKTKKYVLSRGQGGIVY